jgi:hypothetical protein
MGVWYLHHKIILKNTFSSAAELLFKTTLKNGLRTKMAGLKRKLNS